MPVPCAVCGVVALAVFEFTGHTLACMYACALLQPPPRLPPLFAGLLAFWWLTLMVLLPLPLQAGLWAGLMCVGVRACAGGRGHASPKPSALPRRVVQRGAASVNYMAACVRLGTIGGSRAAAHALELLQ